MPQTRQASLYEVQGKTRDDGRFYMSHLCPNDGGLVMPYIGDMGPHDEGHCFKCNQAVKFVNVDEREVAEWRARLNPEGTEPSPYIMGGDILYPAGDASTNEIPF